MALYTSFHNGKPDAIAAGFAVAGGVDTLKRLKNIGEIGFGYAGAVVFYADNK